MFLVLVSGAAQQDVAGLVDLETPAGVDAGGEEGLFQHAGALRLGAAGYVLKGAPASELLAALDAVGKGQRYLGTGVAELAVQGLTAPGDEALDSLSVRERQIVVMVVQGQSSTEIGRVLHLSPKTVDSYRSRFMAKLATPDVPALVRFAIRNGLIDADVP